jgi:queuosine precursor transporter
MSRLAPALLSVGAYVAFIVLVNWLFVPEQLVEGVTQWSTNTWMGTLYLANVIVGIVFVLRDYAQREIGHKVLLATLLAGIPVWYFAGPGLAIASMVAFTLSELTDWAVYCYRH